MKSCTQGLLARWCWLRLKPSSTLMPLIEDKIARQKLQPTPTKGGPHTQPCPVDSNDIRLLGSHISKVQWLWKKVEICQNKIFSQKKCSGGPILLYPVQFFSKEKIYTVNPLQSSGSLPRHQHFTFYKNSRRRRRRKKP